MTTNWPERWKRQYPVHRSPVARTGGKGGPGQGQCPGWSAQGRVQLAQRRGQGRDVGVVDAVDHAETQLQWCQIYKYR